MTDLALYARALVIGCALTVEACSPADGNDPSSGSGGGTTTSGTTASGSGGATASSGGGGARMLAPCPSDAGAGTVGVWENVSPPAFVTPSNMETIVVVVNPADGSVFAAAGNVTNGGMPPTGTGIYKSSDCGASWTLISTGRNGSKLATGDVWSFRVDPDKPDTMYAANGYGNDPTVYKTTNGGVDWDPLSPDVDQALPGKNNFVQTVAIDPANSLHLAVTFHDSCTSPYRSLCMSTTDDGGATWHEFSGPEGVDGWQENATITIMGATAYVYASPQGAWYTGDTGKTWKQVVMQVVNGYYGDGAIPGPDGTLYLGTGAGVYASRATPSSPLGSSWTLLANSPPASVLITDGDRLFASYAWDTGGHPFHAAQLNDLSTWTVMPSPMIPRGAAMLAYDSARHIVYSANLGGGLWRLTTR